jgi:NSS family neurotransmitter:Na+ symporter
MLANPLEMILWMAITVCAGFLVCSFSLQKGLERISKIMMLGLLALIVILAINSVTLDGALEGIKFYLLPDFSRAMEQGIGNVITAAMNQAFFTLSIGIGSMEIFGSYMTKDRTIGGQAVQICCLDTFVALMAGLIIFPACFSFGVQPDAGPPLIFVTLPNVFMNMAGGRIWGTLFFLFMTFASFSTVIAVFQNLVAACEENFGWKKKKTVIINCLFVLVASVPCVLGYNVWSTATIGGKNILDIEDFLVSNILLPAGALVYLIFCVTRFGWGYDNYLAECNEGKGLKMPRWLKPYFQFVLPILIAVILITGLI